MWNKQKEGNVLEMLDLSVNKTSQIVCVCVCAEVSQGQVCRVRFSFCSVSG